MLKITPKEYYKGLFKEIVEEIKENKKDLKCLNIWFGYKKLKKKKKIYIAPGSFCIIPDITPSESLK